MMTESRVRALVAAHFEEVDAVFLSDGEPGVCFVEIRSDACDTEKDVIELEHRVAEWLMDHDERPAGVAFMPSRKFMDPVPYIQFTTTVNLGRFGVTDADYGTNLVMSAIKSKAEADEKLKELHLKAASEAAACQAMTRGWNCELPRGHGGPHQIHDADNGYRHWDTAGPLLKTICHGPEASLCSGPIYSRRQNSAYEEDASNFTYPVCEACFIQIQEHWAEQWDEYHAAIR